MTVPKVHSVDEFFAGGEQMAAKEVGVDPGSLVVLVAGLPIVVRGSTNLLRVLTIPPSDTGAGSC